MPKTILRIISCLLIILVTLIAGSACAGQSEPQLEPKYAGSITEGILSAMNENDYTKYSEHFDQAMKDALTETAFQQANNTIKAMIGDYVSKEFWKVESEAPYTIVYYKAKFTQEPEDVIVKVVFQETAGEAYVSGLWFDSPKLRGK